MPVQYTGCRGCEINGWVTQLAEYRGVAPEIVVRIHSLPLRYPIPQELTYKWWFESIRPHLNSGGVA